MSEREKLYAVPVVESFDRTAYVRAASKVEARSQAIDPVNWEDADDPMGAGRIKIDRTRPTEEADDGS